MYSITKPVNPKLDFDNPITAGLVLDAEFFEGVGNSTELVASLAGTMDGTAGWNEGAYGWAYAGNSGNLGADACNFTTVSAQNSVTLFSVESLVFCKTLAGSQRVNRIFTKGASPYVYFGAETGNNTNAFEVDIGFSTTVGAWESPANSLVLNTWQHVLMTVDLTVATGSVAPKIYIGGVSQSITTTVAPSGSLLTDDATLIVGNNAASGGVRSWDGYVAYVRYWNRILSAGEASLLAQNPWRIMTAENLGNNYRYIKVGDGMSRSEGAT